MTEDPGKGPSGGHGWVEKLKHETVSYFIVFAYMAAIVLAFGIYRHAIMAEYGLGALPVAFGLIEAAIIAKIVVIGQVFKVGARFDGRPLAWTVLWRATAFALLTALFSVVEEGVKRLLHHQKIIDYQAFDAPWAWDQAMAHAIVLFVAFIPLFAIQQLGQVIGMDRLAAYFFGERHPKAPGTKG